MYVYIYIYIKLIYNYERLCMMSRYYISFSNLRVACRLHFLVQRKATTFQLG